MHYVLYPTHYEVNELNDGFASYFVKVWYTRKPGFLCGVLETVEDAVDFALDSLGRDLPQIKREHMYECCAEQCKMDGGYAFKASGTKFTVHEVETFERKLPSSKVDF